MPETFTLPETENLVSSETELDILARRVRDRKNEVPGTIEILEAGCGRKWPLKLDDLDYTLTGVDFDGNALELRKTQQKDLDVAIVGDLRTVSLPAEKFDLAFSSNVIEHIDGAEKVLENVVTWVKPGGVIMLKFPNRDSVYSFVTRTTPFWVHVWYKKHIQKVKNAGKPGFDPYPVSFDRVVSRRGMYEFAKKHGLVVEAEYRMDRCPVKSPPLWWMIKLFLYTISLLSLGTLSVDYRNLLFVLRKPARSDGTRVRQPVAAQLAQ